MRMITWCECVCVCVCVVCVRACVRCLARNKKPADFQISPAHNSTPLAQALRNVPVACASGSQSQCQ